MLCLYDQVARTAVADYVFDRTNPSAGSLVVHFCKTSRYSFKKLVMVYVIGE